ncbi:MAG: PQQ-like beta-propeller repeat protein [Xanthomonadales bacterium]|nr:PQQ-like beta-propeller repeat protein [Xanthomonadales bacterium]
MSQGIRNGALAVAVLCGMLGIGSAQAQSAVTKGDGAGKIPVVRDWSSRSVIHRNPRTPEEFERTGRTAEMRARYRDPRYVASVMRRIDAEAASQPQALLAGNTRAGGVATATNDRRRGHGTPGTKDGEGSVLRDWSNVLGGGASSLGGSGVPGVFPAKYNFDITATPSCANDFVVYPTNAAGAASSGNAETQTFTMTGNQNPSGTITIGSAAPRQVVLTAANDNSGTNFDVAGNNAAEALSLANAANRWSGQTGIVATASGDSVIFAYNTGGNPGGNVPITDNLTNFGSTATANGTGSAGQPTVIAFNQLYNTTCNATRTNTNAPNVMWAYNTGTGYVVETSPVLSYEDDGKQVAFIQRNGNTLQLVLLKWAGGQGSAGAPATPGIIAANGAGYAAQRTNAGSVMYVMTLNGTSNVGSTPTYSSPFVDYGDDVLWVGDGNGRLHKFTGVFKGTPTEVVGGGFPATLEAGLKLSPPVSNNGQVYVGSSAGTGTVGGKLYRVSATNGVVQATSAKLTRDDTPGVRESPIIDAATGQIYTFVYNDNTSVYTDTGRCNAFTGEIDGCRAVIQFAESFANNNIGSRQFIGRGNGTSRVLYAGAFDDAFYSSNNGTGALYIVGGQPDNTFYATLWKIPIVNGVMGTPIQGQTFGNRDRYQEGSGAQNGTDNLQQLSPVTVVKNGSNEYLFASISTYGDLDNLVGCGAGTFDNSACIYMYNLSDLNGSGAGTGAAWGTGNIPTAGLAASGGTGGIVVDNTSATTGTSQIYFTQLQSGGNAIQASQSGLQ